MLEVVGEGQKKCMVLWRTLGTLEPWATLELLAHTLQYISYYSGSKGYFGGLSLWHFARLRKVWSKYRVNRVLCLRWLGQGEEYRTWLPWRRVKTSQRVLVVVIVRVVSSVLFRGDPKLQPDIYITFLNQGYSTLLCAFIVTVVFKTVSIQVGKQTGCVRWLRETIRHNTW